jgi:hypothetical protein
VATRGSVEWRRRSLDDGRQHERRSGCCSLIRTNEGVKMNRKIRATGAPQARGILTRRGSLGVSLLQTVARSLPHQVVLRSLSPAVLAPHSGRSLLPYNPLTLEGERRRGLGKGDCCAGPGKHEHEEHRLARRAFATRSPTPCVSAERMSGEPNRSVRNARCTQGVGGERPGTGVNKLFPSLGGERRGKKGGCAK